VPLGGGGGRENYYMWCISHPSTVKTEPLIGLWHITWDYTYSGSLKVIPTSNWFEEVIHGLHNIFGFYVGRMRGILVCDHPLFLGMVASSRKCQQGNLLIVYTKLSPSLKPSLCIHVEATYVCIRYIMVVVIPKPFDFGISISNM
jgi:hypothetical protein